jgi:Major Facilitator Superfamily.
MKTNKIFTIDLLSRAISGFGDLLFYPIMLMLAMQTQNPARAILFVSLSESIPIILGVVIGAFADNVYERLKTMHILNLLRFALYVFVGIFFFQDGQLAFYLTIGINFFSDCIGRGYQPIANAILKSYVSEEKMVEKQGIIQSVQAITQVVAPMIGGWLVVILHPSSVAFINSATFILASIVLFVGQKQFKKIEKNMQDSLVEENSENVLQNIKTTIIFLFTEKRSLLPVIFTSLAINLLFSPFQKMALPLHLVASGASTNEMIAFHSGIIGCAFSVGIIIGALVAKFFTKFKIKTLITLTCVISAPFIVATGLLQSILIISFLMLITGIFVGVTNTLFSSIMMNETPTKRIGVFTNVIMLICTGGMVFGDLLGSILLNVISPSTLIISIGIASLVVGGIYYLLASKIKTGEDLKFLQ